MFLFFLLFAKRCEIKLLRISCTRIVCASTVRTLDSSCDNGAISPVIQTTNGSRVPSSRPRTDVRPRGKDAMSNAEHKVERKR